MVPPAVKNSRFSLSRDLYRRNEFDRRQKHRDSLFSGRFWQSIPGADRDLTFGGIFYPFVADYFGGAGNDLLLQWAASRLVARGDSSYGQMGDGGTIARDIPVPVNATDALAGRTIFEAGHRQRPQSGSVLGRWTLTESGGYCLESACCALQEPSIMAKVAQQNRPVEGRREAPWLVQSPSLRLARKLLSGGSALSWRLTRRRLF